MAHLPRSLTSAAALALGLAFAPALAPLAGCTPPAAPSPAVSAPAPPAPATSASAAPARTGWDDAPWGRFHSRRFALWLALPDGKTWRINDHKASWLLATHAPSSSSLAVRVFAESEAVNHERCERLARQEDPSLPTETQGRLLSRQTQGVLAGWDARSFVTTEVRSKPHQPLDLEGHLVAIGALVHKCLVVHYATRAVGAGAEATLGARLAEAAEIVRKIEVLDELQGPGREPPEPTAPSPPTR